MRVYQRDTSVALGWSQLGNDFETNNHEGIVSCSLNAAGTILAFGDRYMEIDGNNLVGAVKVYELNENQTPKTWTQLGTDIYPNTIERSRRSLVSLSADGLTVAFGSPEARMDTQNLDMQACTHETQVFHQDETKGQFIMGAQITGSQAQQTKDPIQVILLDTR